MHIAFTGHCPDTFMERIAKVKKLAQRVQSFIEVYMDFRVYNDNVFLAPQFSDVISHLEHHMLTEGEMSKV